MNRYNQPVELLIEQPASKPTPVAKKKGLIADANTGTLKNKLKAAGIEVSSIKTPAGAVKSPAKKSRKPGATNNTIHVKTKVRDTEINPWDMAHLAAKAIPGSFV